MAKRVIPLTRSRALIYASKYGLEREVAYLIDHQNLTPEEALSEWDIL